MHVQRLNVKVAALYSGERIPLPNEALEELAARRRRFVTVRARSGRSQIGWLMHFATAISGRSKSESSSAKRAVRICFPFVGDAVGGSHICAVELITKLPATIEAVVLIHRDGPLADYLKLRGIEFERAPRVDIVEHASVARQILTMGSAAPRLATFLRTRRIDLVHTNDARMHMTWLLAAKLCGAPFVWHQHSATGSRRWPSTCAWLMLW